MNKLSKTYKRYIIIMVMDRASWHTNKKYKNIIPLFQLPYSPELNPVESIWRHIRMDAGFKNEIFVSVDDVETKLANYMNNIDDKIVKSIINFKWIKQAIDNG